MEKIYETKDYTKFELNDLNRPIIEDKKFNELLKSMDTHGWISAPPLHVVINGSGKLKIKDGHNRFAAAKKLSIPIKYVVCDDKIDLFDLVRLERNWSLKNWLDGFASKGIQDYITLKMYHKETGIPLMVCLEILTGNINKTGNGNNILPAFKTGKWKIGNPTHANRVADVIGFCSGVGIEFSTNSRFVFAINRILHVLEIDIDELKHKIITHIYMMKKQATVDGYISMLESVYNRNRVKKIPVAIMAQELAKKRNPMLRGKKQ